MTATTECPTCGQTFDRESKEEADTATISHMSSKTDEDHSGIGYQKASQILEVNSAAGDGLGSGTTESGTDSQDGADDVEAEDDPGNDLGSDPGSMDADPGSDNPTIDGGPPDADVCPDCGCEDYYSATEVLRAGDYGPEETRVLTEHERVCVDCHEVYSPDG